MTALQTLVCDSTAGDPTSGLRWTHRSLRKLCKALRRLGYSISPTTAARLLRAGNFSLRTCRKRQAGLTHPERDRQFRYLTHLRRCYISRGFPVISVDTKKKEWIGEFQNAGRAWRRTACEVLDHDFPTWSKGRAIPVGVYDVAHNDGLIGLGTSHETPTFEVSVIRRWWLMVGRQRYASKRLLIEADSGRANDHRKWEWKWALQALADEFGLTITVTHYPPGASKWNPIDHRMFSLISGNWSGEPLVSYETMLQHIRTTRSASGFCCRAYLDTRRYATRKVPREQRAAIRLKRRSVLPHWNYTICPHHPKRR